MVCPYACHQRIRTPWCGENWSGLCVMIIYYCYMLVFRWWRGERQRYCSLHLLGKSTCDSYEFKGFDVATRWDVEIAARILTFLERDLDENVVVVFHEETTCRSTKGSASPFDWMIYVKGVFLLVVVVLDDDEGDDDDDLLVLCSLREWLEVQYHRQENFVVTSSPDCDESMVPDNPWMLPWCHH